MAVERRRSHPIVERERLRVADAQAPLLGRIDEENAAERPERLTAERLLGLLIENDDPLARFRQFRCRDQAGQTGPHDDYVGIVSHRFAPYAIQRARQIHPAVSEFIPTMVDKLKPRQ